MKKLTSHLIVLLAIVFAVTSFKSPNNDTAIKKKNVSPPKTKKLPVEKANLTIGFIKLTDMAPLAIAKFLGYFEEKRDSL